MEFLPGDSLWWKPMLTCVSRKFLNAPISLKFKIEKSHRFLSLSLRNTPLTQRWTTKSKICAWCVTRITIKIIQLSLNSNMNNFEWSLQGEYSQEKYQNAPMLSKWSWKRYPYYPNLPKKIPFPPLLAPVVQWMFNGCSGVMFNGRVKICFNV